MTEPSRQLPDDPQTVAALYDGVLAIVEGLDVEETLHRIVESARRVTGARYAACGVPGGGGFLHFIHSGLSTAEVAQIGHLPSGAGLLGEMLARTESLRLDRVQDHTASTGFPANHPPMTRFLGVPILYRERNIGDIYLCDKEDELPFAAEDQLAVEALAGVAAVAITNAYQFLQVNEQLEHRRQELDDANRTLKGLSDRMLWALESERRVIAQELHDGLGQSLAAAGIAADAIIDERGVVKDSALRLRSILRGAVADVRRISQGLRPTMLDELGPVAAIRDVVGQLDNEGGTRVEFATRGSARRLPEPIETVIFRVAQEALTNAVRHSQAKEINTELIFEPARVVLRVTDNGIGMPALLAEQGLGIAGMRERAALIGATLEIDSRPGHGVVVTLDVPTE